MRIKTIFLFILFVYLQSNVFAVGKIAFKGSLGFGSAKFSAGEIYDNVPLKAKIYIKPELNVLFPSINTALIFYFQGLISSPYGIMPLSGLGAGGVFYPSGMPLVKKTSGGDTNVVRKKSSPYLGLSMGLANLSISDINNNISFGSVFIEAIGTGGIDFPISNDWFIGSALAYSLSFAGSKNSGSSRSAFGGFYFLFHLGYVPD